MRVSLIIRWALYCVFLLSLLLTLAAALAPEGGIDFLGFFVINDDNIRWLYAIAALSGLLAVSSALEMDSRSASLLTVSFLGLVSALAMIPPISFNISGNADDDGGASNPFAANDPFEQDQQEARSSALRRADNIPENRLIGYDDEITLRQGYAALRFTLSEPRRLRIDVEALASGDPTIEVREGRNIDGALVEADDDGGDNLNSRIERTFAEGEYALLIHDLSFLFSSGEATVFRVRISSASLENLAPEERTATIVASDTEPALIGWLNQSVSDSDTNNYRIFAELGQNQSRACLLIDAWMVEQDSGDTAIGLFDGDYNVIDYNDDFEPDSLASRIVHPVDDKSAYFIGVNAVFGLSTNYHLSVQLLKRDSQNGCVLADIEHYSREEIVTRLTAADGAAGE